MERGLRLRRRDRQTALELRPKGGSFGRPLRLLRRRQSRARGLQGQALSRYARRPPRRAQHENRRPGVGRLDGGPGQAVRDHRCAADRQRARAHRQRRCGVRCARVPVGVRCRDGKPRVARVHGAGRSVEAVRNEGARGGGEDMARRVVEDRRRRYDLGSDRVRPRPRPRLLRHRQRYRLVPRPPRWRRQSLRRVDSRREGQHR